MRFRHPMANALNHGSSGDGVAHWWAQRLSAIFLGLLTMWTVYALSVLAGSDYESARQWLSSPIQATVATLFVLTALYHATLGLQVVIEDYIHQRALEVFLMVGIKLAAVIGAFVVVFSMFQIAVGG
jgi:succinate dehydrogenase / fumarate reductase membrane anchor subunit